MQCRKVPLFTYDDGNKRVVFKKEIDISFRKAYAAFSPVFIVCILFKIVVIYHSLDYFTFGEIENFLPKKKDILITNINTRQPQLISIKKESQPLSIITKHGCTFVYCVFHVFHRIRLSNDRNNILYNHAEKDIVNALFYRYIHIFCLLRFT